MDDECVQGKKRWSVFKGEDVFYILTSDTNLLQL